jgi:hypothetical protein
MPVAIDYRRVSPTPARFLAGVALGCLLVLMNGCHTDHATGQPESAVTAQESTPLLKAIESDWRRQQADIELERNGKDRYAQATELLRRTIQDRIGDDKMLTRRLIDEILVEEDEGFPAAVLQEMIVTHCRQNDRDALVSLFAQHCPKRMYLDGSIEEYLVIVFHEQLPDGLLVLCDAFDRSKSDRVRRQLAEALRRGLTAVGVDADDDEEFVAASREWYERNRSAYDFNWEYLQKGIHPDFDERIGDCLSPNESRRRTGLFKRHENEREPEVVPGAIF